MRYLHGDSSPFPVNENFLETLCAATDACVALFRADIAAEHARDVRASSARAVAHELGRVDRLTHDIGVALDRHVPPERPDAANATEAAALRIAELTKGAIDDTRASIARWSEQTIAQAVAAIPDVDAIVSAFLLEHQLPGTAWSFEWKAELHGSPGRAVMVSATDSGLNASYELAIPPGHLWAGPVRGSALVKRAIVALPKVGWFGKERMANERLDKLFVTHVRKNAESSTMTLSTSRRDRSPGIEITLRSSLGKGVSALRLDAAGGPIGERVALDGGAVEAVQSFWDRIEATTADLASHRRRVLLASVGEMALGRFEKPGKIADLLVDALTPIVAEMLRHSRARGELALKRDLGDGRREEMFIAHDEVTKRWADLPPEYQARFDSFDLEDGRTSVMTKSELASLPIPSKASRTTAPVPSSRRAPASRPRAPEPSHSSISAF